MLGLLGERLTSEAAAQRVFGSFVDAELIWAEVSALPPHAAPGGIACCEVAFARIAIMKFMFQRTQSHDAADALCAAADRMTQRTFPDEGDAQTLAFYGKPLHEAAPAMVDLYFLKTSAPRQLAAMLLERLGGDVDKAGHVTAQLEQLGNDIGAQLRGMRIRLAPEAEQFEAYPPRRRNPVSSAAA